MHRCSICGYVAKYPSYLARHMLCHSGEKPIVCEICGQRFRTVSERNMHRRVHDPMELTCNTCGFRTPLKKVMDRHMLVHAETKPLQCPHCKYRCKRRMDLNKHLASMHSGNSRRKHHEEVTCALLAELGVVFEREVVVHFPVPARRKYARVDVFWRTTFGAVIFEVDEYAHRAYEVEYECQRMILIQKALSAKLGGHLHIVRYNPHPIRG